MVEIVTRVIGAGASAELGFGRGFDLRGRGGSRLTYVVARLSTDVVGAYLPVAEARARVSAAHAVRGSISAAERRLNDAGRARFTIALEPSSGRIIMSQSVAGEGTGMFYSVLRDALIQIARDYNREFGSAFLRLYARSLLRRHASLLERIFARFSRLRIEV